MLTSILLTAALGAQAALPTCDSVVQAAMSEAKAAGFQYLGHSPAPGGDVFMWGSQTKTLALVIVGNPPSNTKLFKFQGQCAGPKGEVGSMFSALLPNQPPL